jgi:hypothetical protein
LLKQKISGGIFAYSVGRTSTLRGPGYQEWGLWSYGTWIWLALDSNLHILKLTGNWTLWLTEGFCRDKMLSDNGF